jgi:hypothetical protein
MAVDISTTKHAVAFPTKVAASAGSPHIFDVKLTAAHDNGVFLTLGSYVELGTYQEGTSKGTITGTIVEQAANGDYYVEIATAGTGTVFVYMPEISPYDNKRLQDEELFYNASGDVVKGYTLSYKDIVSLSAAGFTNTPVVGKSVTVDSTTGKLTVGQ